MPEESANASILCTVALIENRAKCSIKEYMNIKFHVVLR
jgi:hypothetical protein